MKLRLYFIVLFALLFCAESQAQKVGIKSNLLYDMTATINLGVEVGLAPKWTMDISGNYNGWTMGHDRRWKHWAVQPEARYWFCERFQGHFLGLHAHGGQFNVGNLNNGIKFLGTDYSKLSDDRFQGWFAGAGIGYGYQWILGKHWNMSAEIGIGYSYCKYDRYPCADCGTKIEEDEVNHYFGITKLALSLIYLF